jgi:uncharacterized protein YfaS (alpha-2-macroglobulin family)
MNRSIWVFSALLVFVSAIVSLPDPRSDGRPFSPLNLGGRVVTRPGATVNAETRNADRADTFRTDALNVVASGPIGEAADAAQARVIFVTFDRPMAPVQLPDTEVRIGARIFPKVRGRWTWTGTRTLSFTPARPLPLSTGFTVVFPEGVQALDGARLADTFSLAFSTPRMRVLSVSAIGDAEDIGPRDEIAVIFNQDVNLRGVAKALTVATAPPNADIRVGGGTAFNPGADSRSRSVRVRYPSRREAESRWYARSHRSVVLVRPAGSWPFDAAVMLTVAKDARVENARVGAGTLGVRDTFTWSGRTWGPLHLVGTKDSTRNHPYEQLRLEFSSRVRRSELRRHLHIEPSIAIPTPTRGDRIASREPFLWLALQPGETYVIRVDSGLKSLHGRRIEGNGSVTIRTRDLYPSLSMITGQVVLLADAPPNADIRVGGGTASNPGAASRRIAAHLTNVDTIRVRLARVSPEALLGLEEHAWAIDRETRPAFPRNRTRDLLLPVGEVLPTGSGFVRAEVTSSAEQGCRTLALQFTNLGVTAKFAPDSVSVLVTALANADPIKSADVTILTQSRGVVWRGKSDARGLASAPGWNAWAPGDMGNDWEAPEVFVIVKKGVDAAVTSSAWTEGVEAWRFSVDHRPGGTGSEWRGVLFTDRGLYRPGERVHIKGLGRVTAPEGFRASGANLVSLRITGPDGDEIAVRTLPLARDGGFDMDFTVPRDAKVGGYAMHATLGDTATPEFRTWWNHSVTGDFRVSEFRPTRIQASVTTPETTTRFASTVPVRVNGRSLSGAPLAGRSGRVTAVLTTNPPAPRGWGQYSFDPSSVSEWECEGEGAAVGSQVLMDRSVKLDRRGDFAFSLRMPAGSGIEKFGTDASLTVEATITDVTNQSVSARTTRRVEAADVLVGVRAGDGIVEVGRPLEIEAIVLDRALHTFAGRPLRYEVFRRNWQNRRVRASGGGAWVSRPVDERVASGEQISGSHARFWKIRLENAGYHFITVATEDSGGRRIKATTGFYVCGEDASWWRGNDDRVELIPNRTLYHPGDTARVLVRSPFRKARAWITVEREGVVWSRMMMLEGTAPVLEVPVPAELVPNAYLGVVLFDAEKLPEDGTGVRVGLLELSIEPGGKRLRLTVEPLRSEYEPGETASARIRVLNAEGRPVTGNLTIAVVDEGVVSLTAHRFPDAIASLYAPRPHRVTTSDLRTRVIMGRTLGEKGEESAGDGAEGASRSSEGARLRRNFDPCAAWFAAARTDEKGEAVVAFRLPDGITTWRVLVFAAGDGDLYGRGDATFLSRRTLSIEPALPRIIRPGDELEAAAVVRNFGALPLNVEVVCDAPGARVRGTAPGSFAIPSDAEKRLTWRIIVPAASRDSVIAFRFTARSIENRRASDAMEVVVPIVRPRLEVEAATSGTIERGATTEAVRIPADAIPGSGGVVITLASTGLSNLSGAADYLFEYPYGCLEQRTSRAVPILEFGEIAAELGLNGLPGGKNDFRRVVEEWLAILPDYQARDGGYSLWSGADRSYLYLTAIVVKAAARAKKRGYEVDARSFAAATARLQQHLSISRRDPDAPYRARAWSATDAAAVEALAEAGKLRAGDLEIPYREREGMPIVGQAALYRAAVLSGADAAMRADLRGRLLNALRVAPTTAHFEEPDASGLGWIYHSDVTATAAALEAVLEENVPFTHAAQVIKWLSLERRHGRWRSTRENAAVFAAFGSFYRRFESETPDFTARVLMEGVGPIAERFRGRETTPRVVQIPLEKIARRDAEIPVRIAADGAGRLYYELRLIAARPNARAMDAGFSVERRLETMEGRPVDAGRLEAGRLYRLRVTVTTRQARLFVVCDAPLPAGLEGVDRSLATEARLGVGSRSNSSGCWWNGFQRFEVRDDRLVWFADELSAGRHELVAVVRSTSAGSFSWPGTRSEAMYEPEVCGRSAGGKVVVRGGGR